MRATSASSATSRRIVPAIEKRLHRRGIPGVVVDLEPHLKGGGQYGGFSGPDGFGVALRSLCRVLDYVGIEYHLAISKIFAQQEDFEINVSLWLVMPTQRQRISHF